MHRSSPSVKGVKTMRLASTNQMKTNQRGTIDCTRRRKRWTSRPSFGVSMGRNNNKVQGMLGVEIGLP